MTCNRPCGLSEIPSWIQFDVQKLIFDCHMDKFSDIFNKIELRLSESGKPLVFWIFWFVPVVVWQILMLWINHYGKFMFSRRSSLEMSESFEKFYSYINAETNCNHFEYFCALQSSFLELSWCEALSQKRTQSYYVDFSVNSQTGKVLNFWC